MELSRKHGRRAPGEEIGEARPVPWLIKVWEMNANVKPHDLRLGHARPVLEASVPEDHFHLTVQDRDSKGDVVQHREPGGHIAFSNGIHHRLWGPASRAASRSSNDSSSKSRSRFPSICIWRIRKLVLARRMRGASRGCSASN